MLGGRRSDVVEAPPSRYRVIERGGRLVVYDRGAPVGDRATPAAQFAERKAAYQGQRAARDARSAAAPGAGGLIGLIDGWARALADMASQRREPNGRLILRTPRGATQASWLSARQARVYGWALLALVAGGIMAIPVPLLVGDLGEAWAVIGGLSAMLGALLVLGGAAAVLLIRLIATGQKLS